MFKWIINQKIISPLIFNGNKGDFRDAGEDRKADYIKDLENKILLNGGLINSIDIKNKKSNNRNMVSTAQIKVKELFLSY